MLRSVVLSVANRPAVRKAVTGGIGRRVALRFVAGEELDHAIKVVEELNERGFDVSLDYLGENVTATTWLCPGANDAPAKSVV